MKLSYYGHAFTEIKTGNKTRMPINDFIGAFCQFKDPEFKNKSYTMGSIFICFMALVICFYSFRHEIKKSLKKSIPLIPR